jgi:signal transduction histidine kinase
VWIDQQEPKLTTQGEKDALQKVKSAFQDYLRRVQELPTEGLPPVGQSDSLAEFAGNRAESQHLFDLGEALAREHQASRDQLLAYSNARLAQLRLMVLGSLGLLFVFVVALAVLAYRDMIAPLRVKLVESQLLAERREKLASLGILAAGVAHEIRNPLTAIKAALFIQQKRFRPGSREREDTDLVQREILRLEHIVNDFLLFARPTEPDLATVPADQPLQEVRRLLASELADANIGLVVEAPEALRIQADVGQIKQVLINLVQNAADSIGRDGMITLRARADRKRLAEGEQEVVILEVADTGKGIPPEVGRRLFDPFFTTKDNGTGLGLSIAARIVQKHGGALQYQTQVNRGTTFGIVLPHATA